jgi:hypothetical protein
MKRCFVISPIGDEGSEVREHADAVLDFIIRPAMKELGYEAYRSDHSHVVGKISDQMFGSILQDDLCIALLTFQNPNVYYELAVAQSAARPVIIIALKDTVLPFDVKDMRTVYYDLKPRPLFDGVYTKEIIEKVRYLESESIRVVPFAPELSPLAGSQQFGSFVKAEDYGTSDKWVEMVRESTDKFNLCGISVGRWTRPVGIRELFISKVMEGCQVRVLIMAPDNPTLASMMNEKANQGSIAKTKQEIQETTAFFQGIGKGQPDLQIRHIKQACLHQFFVVNDLRSVVVPYLYSNATFLSPLFDFPNTSGMYTTFAREFESLWEEAAQITIVP